MLPKPNCKGVKSVSAGSRFEADEVIYQQVRGSVSLIEILSENQGSPMEKLITEQPPIVTTQGTVEFYKEPAAKRVNEQIGNQEDILLNESPSGLDGIEIV